MMQEGFVALRKPAGLTSFQALEPVKRALRTGKVGHTGTLDRFASGLLLLMCGRLTRLASLVEGLDKHYRATIAFGRQTETLDPEGSTVEECDCPGEEALRQATAAFTGEISQVPPAFSAVHVEGTRAHRLARDGADVAMRPRSVTVRELRLAAFRDDEADIEVVCSKGTYVRSLARDLAHAAGSCGYVSSLERTRIGSFSVEDAVAPDEFDPRRDLQPVERLFDHLPGVHSLPVREEAAARVRHGQPIRESFFPSPPGEDGIYALFDASGTFIAIVERAGGDFSYRMVVPEGSGHR